MVWETLAVPGSTSPSSTAVTATDCGVSQLAGVKVSSAGANPSSAPDETGVTVTSAVGCVARRSV